MPIIPRTEFDETDGLVMSIEPTVSATECTGLIPSGGVDESEAEAYDELYDIHIDREDR